MLQIELLWAYAMAFKNSIPADERDRGDGVLVWVVVVAALVVVALAVVALIKTKATTQVSKINTQ
jgi:hypothetical protein